MRLPLLVRRGWSGGAGQTWVVRGRVDGGFDAVTGPCDKHVLDVAQSLHFSDAFTSRIVDADLCTDVTLAVERQQLDCRISGVAQPCGDLMWCHPRLVVVADD